LEGNREGTFVFYGEVTERRVRMYMGKGRRSKKIEKQQQLD